MASQLQLAACIPSDSDAIMAVDPNRYRYKPLPCQESTRLLKLTSLPYSPVIQGNLVSFRWDSMPKYTAISYTCGSYDITDRLNLEGKTYLPITQTRAYILSRAPRGRWLWIDAVCINQDDNDEKAHQLREMWRIYSSARLVMVWLGDLSDDADIALEFLRLWEPGATLVLEDNDPLAMAHPDVRAFWNAMDAMRWKALVKLLHRPYFRRSWILQELSSARKVLVTCGGRVTVPWRHLDNALRDIQGNSKLIAKLFNARQINDRYQIEQIPSSAHKALSGKVNVGTGETSDFASPPSPRPDDPLSAHNWNRVERMMCRVSENNDASFHIVPDSNLAPPRWRVWLHDWRDSCQYRNCKGYHCTDEGRPSRRPVHVNMLLELHARFGGFESDDLRDFAHMGCCVLAGGFDKEYDWSATAKTFERSRAVDTVIKANVRVRCPTSLDARFAASLPPALRTIGRIGTLQYVRRKSNYTTTQTNIIEFAEFKSADPRDRIYALLSFSFEGLDQYLVPSYNKSVEQVFVSVTRYLMNRDAELTSLHLAGIGWPRSFPTLPSWVPDYTQSGRRLFQDGTLMLLGRATSLPAYGERGGFACWSHRTGEMPGRLKRLPFGVGVGVRGIVVDSITEVLSPPNLRQGFLATATSGSRGEQKKLTRWFEQLRTMFISPDGKRASYPRLQSTQSSASSLNTWDAIVRALTARKLREVIPPNVRPGLGILPQSGLSLVLESPNPLVLEMEKLCMELLCIECISDGDDHMVNTYESNLIRTFCEDLDAFSDWSLFQTSKGFIGRGPRFVETGDVVAAFESVRTPFVLREVPIPIFASPYQLVGEAYVEGMMSREAEFLAENKWWPPGRISLV
jgi:hypothetical protein